MPLRGLDFSRSNQSWSRLNQFLQYDLLDKFRSDRDAALLGISDRLQRERQVEAGNIDVGVAQYKSGLTIKEAYIKAMLDIAKQPHLDSMVSMAHLATDPNLPDEYKDQARGAAEEYAKLVIPLAKLAFNASRGTASWEDYTAGLAGGGTKLMTETMQESGQNRRANLVAGTEEKKLGFETTKQLKAEGDEATKRYIDMLKVSIDHLETNGVKDLDPQKLPALFMSGKTLNPLMPEYQNQAMKGLVDLWQRVNDNGAGILTPGNKEFIQKVWDSGAWKSGQRAPAAPGAPTAGAGGVSLETGATPDEEKQVYDAMRRTLIEQKTQEFMNMVYGQRTTPTADMLSQARKNATEYVDTQLMPSIMKK